jgi:HEAT repeat protein
MTSYLKGLLTISLKLICFLALGHALFINTGCGQEKQANEKTKGNSTTSATVEVRVTGVNGSGERDITITLYPCKGEQPGNVLGISEQLETPQRVAAFIKKLSEPDPKVRACAAKQLGYIGTEAKDAVPNLIKLLRDEEDRGVGVNISEALGDIGPETKSTVPERLEMIKDQDVYIRLYGAFALGYYKPHISREKEVVKALTSAAKDKDGSVRWMAVRGLSRLGPIAKDSVPTLIEILKDQKDPLRLHAAMALGNIGPEAATAVPALLDTLYNASDYGLYISIAIALGRIGPITLPLLEKELKTKHTLLILDVLRHMGPSGTALVVEALRMPNKQVRKKAIETLQWCCPAAESAIDSLVQALKDEDKEIRQDAASALKSLGKVAQTAIPALTAALKDKDDLVQCWAAEALGAIGPTAKPAVPELLRLMKLPVQGERDMPQRCAAEGLMTMSSETKALVPAHMIKRVEEWNAIIRSTSVFDSDETKPKPKEKKKPRQIF